MGQNANALSVVRQYLSSAVGDLIMGTFDSGSTTTGVHTLLRKANDYYNNGHYRCYIFAGTGIGYEREVSDWDLTTHTLTFDPAFAATIDATSRYELHHIFTEDEYRRAINMTIQSIAGKYLIDKIDASVTLIEDIYEYDLPDGFSYIHRIITEDEADSGEFNVADDIDPRDWELISPRKLKLHDSRYSITAGLDLRIEGQGNQDTAGNDADEIELPLDWLVQKAITFLPKDKIQSSKLDSTYQQALLLSANSPKNWPNPHGHRVVE